LITHSWLQIHVATLFKQCFGVLSLEDKAFVKALLTNTQLRMLTEHGLLQHYPFLHVT